MEVFKNEVSTLKLGNAKSVMAVSIRKAKHGEIKSRAFYPGIGQDAIFKGLEN